MRTRRLVATPIVIGLTLLVATSLDQNPRAQVSTATISGVVKDETGAVLPGVTMTVRNLGTQRVRTLVTGEEGLYHAPELAPGNYEVQAELPGFQTEVRTGITLFVGREAVVDFVLKVGEISEKLVVTGEAPLVETRTASVSHLIDDRTVRDLPLNGRDLNQLTLLTPGANISSQALPKTTAGYGKMITISGSRPQFNVFLLDGTDVNAFPGGTPASSAGVQLGVESVREFRILSNQFSAEYGRSTGGVISYVTRSGSNEFHGSVFEFHRNSALDAKNFFDLHQKPIPPFKRNQFGFSLGGPLRKDRTFFFGNYEALVERLGLSLIANVPNANARAGLLPSGSVPVHPAVKPYLDLFPLPNGRDFGDGRGEYFSSPTKATDEHYATARIDHAFSQNHNFYGRYTLDDAEVDEPDLIGLKATQIRSRAQYLTLEEKAILSSNTVNALVLAFNRSTLSEFDSALKDISQLLLVPEVPDVFPSIGVTGLATIGDRSSLRPRNYVTNTFQVKDDFSLSRGPHSMRIGANVERFQFNQRSENSAGGNYGFQTLRDFLINNARSFTVTLPGFETFRTISQNLVGFYVQDDWRVHPKVTLNLGLRYEFITVPTERHGRIGQFRNLWDPNLKLSDAERGGPLFENPSLKNFAPRVGLAWDPFGQGRTVIRAGAGLFYDQIMSHYLTFAFNRMPPFFQQGNLTAPLDRVPFPDWKSGDLKALALGTTDGFTFFPNQPYLVRYNLNVQHQLPGNMVFMMGYTGSRGVHLVRHVAADTEVFVLRDGRPFFPTPPVRRNPNFSALRFKMTDGVSDYHGLALSLSRRLTQGLQLQTSYTLAKSTDIGAAVSGNTDYQNDNSMPRFPLGRDPGPAAFDVTHNFVVSSTFDLPFGPNARWGNSAGKGLSQLLSGWQIGGILTAQSGAPFSAYLGFLPRTFITSTANRSYYPDLAPGASNNPVLGGPDRYYDAASFRLPPEGFLGNLGRNTLRMPGVTNVDFSVVKNSPLGEGKLLQFRAEFFNLPNHPNFGLPNANVFTATGSVRADAGRITSTTTTSRQIQFGLKLTF